jgi:hypothetical protein
MHRFLFDLVFHDRKTIETNELLTTSIDEAIDFIDNFYLELHLEGAPGPDEIILRVAGEDDSILHYALHLDAVVPER